MSSIYMRNVPLQYRRQLREEIYRRQKSLGVAYILSFCVFLHNWYLGKGFGRWFIQTATGGLAGFWWIYDLFKMPEFVREYNEKVELDVINEHVERMYVFKSLKELEQ